MALIPIGPTAFAPTCVSIGYLRNCPQPDTHSSIPMQVLGLACCHSVKKQVHKDASILASRALTGRLRWLWSQLGSQSPLQLYKRCLSIIQKPLAMVKAFTHTPPQLHTYSPYHDSELCKQVTNPWSCSRSLVWSSSSSSSRRRGEQARKEDDSSADRRPGGKRGEGERARGEDNSSADGLRRHRSLVFLSSRRGRCRLRRRSAWVLADIVLGSWHIFASHPLAGATAPSAMRMKVSLPSSTSWRDGPRCNEGGESTHRSLLS